MNPRTQERVERWDSRPFRGGTGGLSDLTARDFSGAISAAESWLFVLNGRAVGTIGGDLEDVVDASGTAYEAPDPALPLLASMEESNGETRATYYTNETPLSEVDETLQDGSFTGYIELSEKVLSGDYYLVYYGGRRMAVAFIGNAERLVTGEEAFERAADEVGIYEVIDVDVDVTDLGDLLAPDVAEPEPTADVTGETTGEATVEESADRSPGETSSAVPETEPGEESSSSPGDVSPVITEAEPTDDEAGITASDDGSVDPSEPGITISPDDGHDEASAPSEPEAEPSTSSESEPTSTSEVASDTDGSAAGDDSSGASPTDSTGVQTQSESTDETDRTAPDPSESGAETTASRSDESLPTATGAEDASEEESDLEERFKQEERWRKTRSIPSIDPEKTSDSVRTSRERSTNRDATESGRTETTNGRRTDPSERRRSAKDATGAAGTAGRDTRAGAAEDSATGTAEDGPSGRLATRFSELENRYETLKGQREDLLEQRDRLQSTVTEQSTTIERLQSRIEQLEAELERARSAGGVAGGESTVPVARALAGTNLFVRYGSKSQPTLETAHAGEADAAEVASNLQLEHHTEFDDAEVVVDGSPYEEFLPATMEFQSVDWLVNTLVYEIRDTGRADELADLYDAIPRIDRVEFHASISLADDDTEEVPEEVGFDVVAFDKMGNPLVVVVLNDSREPASQELLEELEASASAVKANYPDLAAALVVTSSFFEPGALEVTEQATSSGFLSRGSKLSYVNLSRKRGYHLCLAEARSGGFHLTVPEL